MRVSLFLIDGLVLRWSVTILFGISIAGYAYIVLAGRERWIGTVNHLLHQVMSIAMIAMVWPVGMHLPTVGPMIFFLLASAWFVVVAARGSCGVADRVTNGYYALMMAAMGWMYAVMNGNLPGQAGQAPGPGWITTVNGFAAVGFAVAAVCWLYRYVTGRRRTPPPTARLAQLGVLCQMVMAAGIAVMFA